MAVQSGDVLRVVAKMDTPGGVVQNTFHVKYSGEVEVGNATFQAAVAGVLDDCYGAFVADLHENLDFVTITFWNVTQDLPLNDTDWPTLVDGGGVGNMLPAQVAALTLYGTAVARSQGRKFWSGFGGAALAADGRIDATTYNHIQNGADDLLGNIDAGDGTFAFGNYRYSDGRFAQWNTRATDLEWHTQRRRTYGQGL